MIVPSLHFIKNQHTQNELEAPDNMPVDRRAALVSVFVAVVVDWMGVSLTQPIMPFYITDVLHGPAWSVGCLYAVFASVQIVGTP